MKKTKEESIVKKSPLLYCVMLIIWICLAVAFWYYFIPKIIEVPYIQGFSASKTVNIVAKIFLMFNALFISYFWLNGVKDFLYVIWYYVFKNRLQKKYLRMAHLVAEGKLPLGKFYASYNAWRNHISHGNCHNLERAVDKKIREVLRKEMQNDR